MPRRSRAAIESFESRNSISAAKIASPDTEVPSIKTELNEAEQALNSLSGALDNLEEIFKPVLKQLITGETSSKDEGLPSYNSEFLNTVQRINDKIDETIARVLNICNRVEI